MGQAVLNPPNAILFVLDPTNKNIVVPPYVDDELTAATNTCVSVGTQAEIDGETEVRLETGAITCADLQQVFLGVIATPGNRVAVVTSNFQCVLEAEVPGGTVEVSIWVDDLREPACVTIGVRPLPTSINGGT